MKKVWTLTFVLVSVFIRNLLFAQTTGFIVDSMKVQESLMVTIEEDFGKDVTTVEAALQRIGRTYEPFDGNGRTFAILDAFGNKMDDGRMHISMHISSEKAGGAKLFMKGRDKLLWNCIIQPKADGTKIAPEKRLNIYIARDDNPEQYYTVDGSGNPASIFDCILDEIKIPVRDFWKEQTVKEFIFIYSACGCPVHAQFLRKGLRSAYQGEDHVFFPDDVAVQSLLHRLLAW